MAINPSPALHGFLARHLPAVILTLTVAALCGCESPTEVPLDIDDAYLRIQSQSDSITLQWDAPESVPEDADSLGYRLMYREHGGTTWRVIGDVAASAAPEYTLVFRDFGAGAYDFAVYLFAAQYSQSALHTSLDANAAPVGGWYLDWRE